MRATLVSSFRRMILFLLFTPTVLALDAFPRAVLVEESVTPNTAYRLVLSELKRIQARTVGEQERLISGDLTRQIWELPAGYELDQVMDFYLEQLSDGQLLYECSALDCGSSNFWANKVFENAKLYGRDARQRYAVILSRGDENHLYVIYAVQRSKQKIYINIDQIITRDPVIEDDAEQQKIMQALKKEAGWLPGLNAGEGRLDQDASAVLIETLRSLDPALKRRLYLVVHCYQANNMADNFACSTRIAQQLRAAVYDGDFEVPVYGHGALTLPPGDDLKPHLRFMLWPRR